jgi:hypothetical protein
MSGLTFSLLLAAVFVVFVDAGIENQFDVRGVEIKSGGDQQNIPVSQEEMKDIMRKMTEKPSERKENLIPRSNVEPPKSLNDRTPLQQTTQNVKNWLWEEKKRRSRGLLQKAYTKWYQTTFAKCIFAAFVILGILMQGVSWLGNRSLKYEKKYKAQQARRVERQKNRPGRGLTWKIGKRSSKVPKIPLKSFS